MMDEANPLQELKDRAKEAYADDRTPAVVELLCRYLPHRPEDGYAWFIHGDSLRQMGRSSEAIVALEKAMETAPDDRLSDVQIQLGMIYMKMGRFDEAERWFAAAVECDPDGERGWCWIFRGGNFASWEKFEQALECHRRAVELGYNEDEAYLNIGCVLRAQGKYEDAADAFRKALSLTPDYPKAEEALQTLEGIQEALELAIRLGGADERDA